MSLVPTRSRASSGERACATRAGCRRRVRRPRREGCSWPVVRVTLVVGRITVDLADRLVQCRPDRGTIDDDLREGLGDGLGEAKVTAGWAGVCERGRATVLSCWMNRCSIPPAATAGEILTAPFVAGIAPFACVIRRMWPGSSR
ncbi:hypothetical protein ACFWP7_41760 [Streptomyces sp. NPDC058470]|uniref:hypothetical protein n=1 Tax=Streptomyces sp. NPDC058470 TaxID=3346515 RepID=UPI0036495576